MTDLFARTRSYFKQAGKHFWLSCAVFALFALLSILMTYPVVRDLWSAVPGDLGDPLFASWILGWSMHKILHLDFQGFWDTNIFYPAPLVLVYSEHFLGHLPLALPTYLLSGSLLFTYNLLFLASFILSGWGMYVFVKDVTGNQSAGLISGLIFAFFPFRFGQLGHLQVLTVQWLPFIFLFLNRLLVQPTYTHLLLFGFFCLLEVLSCGYYGLFLTPFIGLFVLHTFIARRELPSRDLTRKLLFCAIGLVVLAAPVIYPYIQVSRLLRFHRRIGDLMYYSADLTSYLSAPSGNWIWGDLTRRLSRPEAALHPGLITVFLAALGALLSIKKKPTDALQKRMTQFAVLMALSAYLLSLGPKVQLFGRPLFSGPYHLLYKFAPGFDVVRVPARFGPFFMFAAAILAGYGILEIERRVRTLWIKWLSSLIIGLLILTEYASAPIPTVTVPGKGSPTPVYHWLSSQPANTPIVEIPLHWMVGDIEYVYFSTFHWKDILNGYSSYTPPFSIPAQLRIDGSLSLPALDFLEEIGVRYVIIHMDKLNPTNRETLLAAMPRFHSRLRKIHEFGPDHVYEIIRHKTLSRQDAFRRLLSMPKIFPAEGLPSLVGRLASDPLAQGRIVRRADKGEAGVVIFGPYAPLPSGRYQARFFLRLIGAHADHAEQIGQLDVTTDGGSKRLAVRDLRTDLLSQQIGFQMMPLDFEVGSDNHQTAIECRVTSTGKVAIAVERVEIWPMDLANKTAFEPSGSLIQ